MITVREKTNFMTYQIKDEATEILISVGQENTLIRVDSGDLNPYTLDLNTTDLDDIASAISQELKDKEDGTKQ